MPARSLQRGCPRVPFSQRDQLVEPHFELKRSADAVGCKQSDLISAPDRRSIFQLLNDISVRDRRGLGNAEVVSEEARELLTPLDANEFGFAVDVLRLLHRTSGMHNLDITSSDDLPLGSMREDLNILADEDPQFRPALREEVQVYRPVPEELGAVRSQGLALDTHGRIRRPVTEKDS